jgi:pimeloyl-ACP methyl ester carboxylesterase
MRLTDGGAAHPAVGRPRRTRPTAICIALALTVAAAEKIADASHFLQEDAGEEIGRRIVAWLTRLRDGILSRT